MCIRDRVFNPAYGLTGGEDGDLLMRLMGQGARMVWCDEAYVIEPVPENRMRTCLLYTSGRRRNERKAYVSLKDGQEIDFAEVK